MTSIQTDNYLRELINYLKDSLSSDNISFRVRLCDLQLEVSQAISLGVILNEALTNIIKYAFPEPRSNAVVIITLSRFSKQEVQLVIEDHGIGFCTDEWLDKRPRLGLTLIRGLSHDLSGTIEILSGEGTKISLKFSPKVPKPSGVELGQIEKRGQSEFAS